MDILYLFVSKCWITAKNNMRKMYISRNKTTCRTYMAVYLHCCSVYFVFAYVAHTIADIQGGESTTVKIRSEEPM